MSYRAEVSTRARRHLNEILDWILDHYPTEAEEWMLGLERAIASSLCIFSYFSGQDISFASHPTPAPM